MYHDYRTNLLRQLPQHPSLTLNCILLSEDALQRLHFVKVVHERGLSFEELDLELT
jgi:hypothetical protein